MKMSILTMVVVFALVPVLSFGQQEGEAPSVHPVDITNWPQEARGDCVTQDCPTDYFYVPATATDITNWPSSQAAEEGTSA